MRSHEETRGRARSAASAKGTPAVPRTAEQGPAAALLGLQRARGNRFVQRLVATEVRVARDGKKFATVEEEILDKLLTPVTPDNAENQAKRLEELRALFDKAPPERAKAIHDRLANEKSTDAFTVTFQKLPADWKTYLLGILEAKYAGGGTPPAPAPAPGPAPSRDTPTPATPTQGATPGTGTAAPPPAAPTVSAQDRAASQRTHLSLVRGVQKEMAASFALLDAALTSTTAYAAYVQVRQNVMQDVVAALDAAEQALASPTATAQATTIQTKLEQAQLWLYYMTPYAHLAALIRSAEHDRLVTSVIVESAKEADVYAKVFSVIGLGTAQALAAARGAAVALVDHTKKLLDTLQEAIKKGEKAVATAHKVEAVLDIPLEFGAGRVLPPIALVAILAFDRKGFYDSHKAQFDVILANAGPLVSELGWLELNAPLSRRHFLHPVFKGMLLEAYHGATLADAAFILGRVLKAIAEKKNPVDWKTIAAITAKVIGIVTLLHSPKLAVAGLASVTNKTRESVKKAIGGDKDPQGVVADLNRELGTNLTQDEAVDLLIELTTPPVEDHLKNLSNAVGAVSPHILAIVADVAGTGVATQTTIAGAQSTSYPLLPPAP